MYILPGFPSPTNSHDFWATPPPQPAVAGEEDDEAAVLLAGPFAPMLLRLEQAKEMRGGHLGSKEPNQPTNIDTGMALSPPPKSSSSGREWKGWGEDGRESRSRRRKKVKAICPRGNNKVIIYFLIS